MTDEELRRLFEVLRTENAEEHAKTRLHIARTSVDTPRAGQVIAEGLRHEVRLLANAVGKLEKTVDRQFGVLHEKLDRGFAETQALIKSITDDAF